MYIIEKQDFVPDISKIENVVEKPTVTYSDVDADREKMWNDICTTAIDDSSVFTDNGWAIECDLGTQKKSRAIIRSQMTGEVLEMLTLMKLTPDD